MIKLWHRLNTLSRKDWMIIIVVLTAFVLPFHTELTRYLIGGFLGVWLIDRLITRQLKGFLRNPILWVVILFYLLHVISLVYSSNKDQAFFDLERKLTLLLLPVAFAGSPVFTERSRSWVLVAFIAGSFTVTLICAGLFIQNLTDPDYLSYFLRFPLYVMYRDFSNFNHPTYYSLFLELSIIFLLYLGHPRRRIIRKSWIIILVVFFTAIVFVVSSRAAIVSLGVIYLLTIMMCVRRWIVRAALIAGLIAAGIVALSNYRFDNYMELTRRLARGGKVEHAELVEKGAMRLVIWDVTLELSRTNLWWGIGTGDIREELIREYEKRDIRKYMQRSYNPHSQYLSSLLGLGVTGLAALLTLLIWPLALALRRHDYPAAAFLVLFMIHFIFESMLNRSPGILSFALFYGFFIFNRGSGRAFSQ